MSDLEFCVHEWMTVATLEHVEVDEDDPVTHTTVVVLGCVKCRTVDLFPASNAALMTPRFVEDLRRSLTSQGWSLPPGIGWGPQ